MVYLLGFAPLSIVHSSVQTRPKVRPLSMIALPEDETIESVAENVVQVINLFGGGTLVLAALLGTINFVLSTVNATARRNVFEQFMPLDFDIGAGPATLTKVRLQLAQMIALGLGILLIGDVLETLVKSTSEYDYDSLYKLAIVAAIRSGLSFFLSLETEEIYEVSKSDARLDGRDFAYQESKKSGKK
mmetsp:Transcript_21724/g.28114  ORF Transcript_21724/g.28114 Transcript_21724/m.28114 type:complete len:188 (-) Transcript_21724:1154-1717(-)